MHTNCLHVYACLYMYYKCLHTYIHVCVPHICLNFGNNKKTTIYILIEMGAPWISFNFELRGI